MSNLSDTRNNHQVQSSRHRVKVTVIELRVQSRGDGLGVRAGEKHKGFLLRVLVWNSTECS